MPEVPTWYLDSHDMLGESRHKLYTTKVLYAALVAIVTTPQKTDLEPRLCAEYQHDQAIGTYIDKRDYPD